MSLTMPLLALFMVLLGVQADGGGVINGCSGNAAAGLREAGEAVINGRAIIQAKEKKVNILSIENCVRSRKSLG